jgi:glycosyltransferase involved in cell wall biosynthesis
MACSLYVAFDVFPRAKGSSSHIASMIQAMARNFGSVRVLCLGLSDMAAYQQEGGIEIYRFQARHRDLLRRATAFARFVTAHTRKLADKLKLAVFRDPWGGYPLLAAARGCPSIFEVNALPSWELPYSRPEIASSITLDAKLRDMERRCLRDCHRVLCVSTVTARALEGAGCPPVKTTVVPNVAHDVFFDASNQPCPIPELDRGRWFGYIGGLQPWQGIDALIKAFALVAPDLPGCGLLILCGDTRPATARALQRLVDRARLSGRVVIHSPVAQQGVAGTLARLRFTAVPLADTLRNTGQGCCPVKMVESMAAGTPVVASDLAVCREWVAHDRDALLAPAGDTRTWAIAIHRLFSDDSLIRRLGDAARRTAQQHFSWSSVHLRLDHIFQQTATLGGTP